MSQGEAWGILVGGVLSASELGKGSQLCRPGSTPYSIEFGLISLKKPVVNGQYFFL
jgi:hypothetical protein